MDFLIGAGFALAVCLSCLLAVSFGRKRGLGFLTSFSAGGLLAVSFLDFLPESFEGSLQESAGAFVLAGILAQGLADVFLAPRLKFLDRLLTEGGASSPHRHRHSHLLPASAVCSVAGCLALCSFFDGIRLFAGLSLKGAPAAMTAIALFFHLLSEGVLTVSLGFAAGMKNRVLFVLIFFLSGALLLGFLLGKIFSAGISFQAMIAFSTGILIYVCFIHLLPAALKDSNKNWFFAGLLAFSAAHYLFH